MTDRTIAYLDGSQLLYRAEHGFPARIFNRIGDDVTGLFGFLALMRKALRTAPLRPTHALVVFDADAPLVRSSSDSRYKAGRRRHASDDEDNPFRHLPWIQRALSTWGIPCFEHESAEADDVIATLVERITAAGDRAMIVSSDRDFHQLLTKRVAQWDSSKGTTRGWITPSSVTSRYGVEPGQWCDFVALVGDRTDGMPGIPGVGLVTARRILHAGRLLYDVVEELSSLELLDALRQRELHRLDGRLPLPHLAPGELTSEGLPTAAEALDSLGIWNSCYP